MKEKINIKVKTSTDDHLPEYYNETKKSVSEFILQSIFLFLVFNLETTYYNHSYKSTLSSKLKETFVKKQFNSPVTNSQINFKKIMTHHEFYAYLKNVFVKLSGTEDNTSVALINFQNYLIGVPRIHIKQVNPVPCQSFFNKNSVIKDENEKNNNFDCYTDWSTKNEKKVDRYFKENLIEKDVDESIKKKLKKGFRFIKNDKKLCYVIGELNRYDCEGFYVELFRKQSLNTKLVENLEKLQWIDSSTRLINIKFNLYNPSYKYTIIVNLVNEFINSGGAVNTEKINILIMPLRNKLCCSSRDYQMLFITFSILCFALLYTYQCFKNLTFYGLRYFKSLWNVFDLVTIIVLYVYLYVRLFLVFHESEKLLDIKDVNKYLDLIYVSIMIEIKYYSISFLIFLTTIRFIKFITFNKTLNYLAITFKKCAADLIGLTITTIIVLMACSITLNLKYGTTNFDYSTIIGCFVSLFRMFWGDFK